MDIQNLSIFSYVFFATWICSPINFILLSHAHYLLLLKDLLLYIVTLISVGYLSQIHKLPTIFVMALFATHRLPFKYSQIFLISKSSILVRVPQQ